MGSRTAAKKLPRLQAGQKPDAKTREVELPDLGATVLLRRPTVGEFTELHEGLVAADASEYLYSIALAATCLVEPELDAEQLKAAVDEWSPTDWMVLQAAALDLTGAGGGALRAAQDQFRTVA